MDTDTAARVLWEFHCVYDALAPCDVIIGLGSYDLRVATECARLFHQGLSDSVLFTGAAGNWTRDLFPASEADAFKAQAISDGVPEDAIILEPLATNIGENIRFSADHVPSAEQAIFVTKPQTQQRCRATAQKQWPRVRSMITAPATAFEDQPLPHHGERALICEMVGDTERITSYAALGYQTEVAMPALVRAAFDVLVDAGFVDHLSQRPVKG